MDLADDIKKLYLVNGNDGRLKEWMADVGSFPEDIYVMVVYTGAIQASSQLLLKGLIKAHERIEICPVDKPKKGTIQKTFISCIDFVHTTRPDIKIAILGPHYSSTTMLDYEMRGIISYANNIGRDYPVEMSDEININDGEIEAGGRMHILIDYENVNEAGLVGSDLLCNQDDVTLFYSEAASFMERSYFEDMQFKAGNFEAVKLKNTGKNGLDFYIAVKVGQIVERHPADKILIVTRDKGYLAIKAYCAGYTELKNPIVIRGSIESGIAVLDGDTERRRIVESRRERLSIETEYAAYQTRIELKKSLMQKLSIAGYGRIGNEVISVIEGSDSPRERYVSALRKFGRDDGMKIYRLIREAI